jgi:hypothetical protein
MGGKKWIIIIWIWVRTRVDLSIPSPVAGLLATMNVSLLLIVLLQINLESRVSFFHHKQKKKKNDTGTEC